MSTCLALAKMTEDMVTKEEKVLLRMAMDTLSERNRRGFRAGEGDIGYAFIEGVPAWPAAGAGAGGAAGAAEPGGRARHLALNTGGLRLEELNLVLGVLPVDFQYVDEHDQVRFYSEGTGSSRAVRRDRPQGAELPPAAERAQGAADHRRVPRRREGQGRVLDRAAGQVPAHPLLRPARRRRRVPGRRGDGAGRHGVRALEGQRRLLDW